MTAQARSAGKRTLTSILTDQIRDRVISGRIPPGAQLNEVELAQRFATSRGPVREALQRLVQDGLLMNKPHRGTYVPVLDSDDLIDLAFARLSLEKAALTRIVARGASARLLARLEQVLKQMEYAIEAKDWHAVADADIAFHESLIHDAGSFHLSRMYASLTGLTRLSLINHSLAEYKDDGTLLDEHRELARLLAQGSDEIHDALDRHHTSVPVHDHLASASARRKGTTT